MIHNNEMGARREVAKTKIRKGRMPRAVIPIAAIIAVAIVGIFVAWPFTADDSYITFRYSKHLAEGMGLVWNAHNAGHVEGYTNFLWMLLMVFPHILGFSAALFSKIIGLVCLAGCGIIIYMYIRKRTGKAGIAFLTLLMFMLLPSTYFHAVSGLETTLYALLILLLFILGLESLLNSNQRPSTVAVVVAPILTLCAGMTRPEGVLPGTIVLTTLYLCAHPLNRRKILLMFTLLLIIPGVLYFLWRYSYFGWLFPNTFYVKLGQSADGIEWLQGTVASVGAIFLLVFFSVIVLRSKATRGRRVGLYYAVFLAGAALPYCMFNLMMNYMSRFLFHLLPVVILMLGLGLNALAEVLTNQHNLRSRQIGIYIVFVAALCVQPLFHNDKLELAHLGLYEEHLQNAHFALAEALREAPVPDSLRTLTVGDAGVIPYVSEWHCYDFIGLNDVTVAHDRAGKSRYIAAAQPTVVILYSQDGRTLTPYQFGFEPQTMLINYENIAYIKWFPTYYLAVFLRRSIDESVFDELSFRIRAVAATADSRNAAGDNRRALMDYLNRRLPGR